MESAEGCLGFSQCQEGGRSNHRCRGRGNGSSLHLRLGLRGGGLGAVVHDMTGAMWYWYFSGLSLPLGPRISVMLLDLFQKLEEEEAEVIFFWF
jgi:hypothetical protein